MVAVCERANDLISIHAPPRGATCRDCKTVRGVRISIHAPPRGATSARIRSDWLILFQFTPLREGRRYFQSAEHLDCISIHAPPRGATRRRSHDGSPVLFQFTPLREGRRQQRQRWLDYQAISIHAPPRGATR